MSSGDPAAAQDLVRCDITGAMVPSDEVITLHGYTVCADGKDQLLEKIRSGELLPGELARPTVLRRFAALFIDGLIFSVLSGILMFAFVMSAFDLTPGATNTEFEMRAWIAGLALTILGIAYITYFHGAFGQTLGKMAAKIKVVNDDGEPIGMSKAFTRALWYYGPTLLVVVPGFLWLNVELWDGVTNGLAGLYFIVSVILALVDRAQQRAIHDRMTKTRVIAMS